jgi:hypothetical protein
MNAASKPMPAAAYRSVFFMRSPRAQRRMPIRQERGAARELMQVYGK